MITMRRFALALFIACVATMAMAVTVEELSARTASLHQVYRDIHSDADACPDGTCPEAASIRAAADQAEQDRALIHADRATLEPCGNCASLDAQIASLDLEAEQVTGIIKGWDEQG